MRCNAGVNPKLLLDQHLIAEYRELLIPVGQLRKSGFTFKSTVPKKFKLGAGHITFWKNKLLYLERRHETLVKEMISRGFQPTISFQDLTDAPKELLNDWKPDEEAFRLIKDRILERYEAKPDWYRYRGKHLDHDAYIERWNNIGAFKC